MDTRVAVIAVLIEDETAVGQVNDILHELRSYIIGRMGLPYRQRGMNIITLMVDGPQDKINTLAGRLGRLAGVTAKAVYAGQ